MQHTDAKNYILSLLQNIPNDWINLTTHRLDIYTEELAKTEFLEQFEDLLQQDGMSTESLLSLPTAFDYIRLGHPLSCILEWTIAKMHGLNPNQVISFSSKTMPILAVLRKNLFAKRNTQILYTADISSWFDAELVKEVYGYDFELKQIASDSDISTFEGNTILVSQPNDICQFTLQAKVDFIVNIHPRYGSVIVSDTEENEAYISEIQHVRRRESIAITPANAHEVLKIMVGQDIEPSTLNREGDKIKVIGSIQTITASNNKVVIGSSGLSIQYAIGMGLVDYAKTHHPDKAIRFIVPPNCYGGTNDQARRLAACDNNIEVLDLPVDRDQNMVQSVDKVLNQCAAEDTIPFIIVEIPTNPRVEVPNLEELTAALSKTRKTPAGKDAITPVFILDQTFCPNVHFLGETEIFKDIQTISYVSGSKFPSGGKCTAGYCTANNQAAKLMDKIEKHLNYCDNEATDLQYHILSEQLPSMNERIAKAYTNTRDFVNFVEAKLPEAKINFVSEELAERGFTPSVFSLDLPTKGESDEERETYKRKLNLKLINMMISEIPNESKFCVSYGQLKGCYWTIPATSTQGTTKEGDKDYIVRVALAPELDLEKHKEVFQKFVSGL